MVSTSHCEESDKELLTNMLTIFNLHARVDDKEILKGVNLMVEAQELLGVSLEGSVG